MDIEDMVDTESYLKGALDQVCAIEDSFIKTNKQSITRLEFIRFMERQKIAIEKVLKSINEQ